MKNLLVTAAAAAAVSIGTAAILRRSLGTHSRIDLTHGLPTRPVTAAEMARRSLLYVVPPIWLAAGVADWLCHRRADIGKAAGPKESLLHLLMQAEMGVPVVASLFLEITPPVVAGMIASFVAHEATALWDVSYAVERREVTPVEQCIHSFMEMMPLVALWLIIVLHGEDFLALFRPSERASALSLNLRAEPLPAGYVASLLGAMTCLGGVPYGEELWRSLRATGVPRV